MSWNAAERPHAWKVLSFDVEQRRWERALDDALTISAPSLHIGPRPEDGQWVARRNGAITARELHDRKALLAHVPEPKR